MNLNTCNYKKKKWGGKSQINLTEKERVNKLAIFHAFLMKFFRKELLKTFLKLKKTNSI